MNSTPPPQEFFWDDLLEYIDERRVIPVVGAELLTVPDGQGGEAPFIPLLAAKLAERLRLPHLAYAGDDALHQVVCRYIQNGGRREEIYPRIRTLLKELNPAVPPILRALAKIRHFNVFAPPRSIRSSPKPSTKNATKARRAPFPSPTRLIIIRTCPPTPAAAKRPPSSISSAVFPPPLTT